MSVLFKIFTLLKLIIIMILFRNSEAASYACGCSVCRQFNATGSHYILVDGVLYFTDFRCSEWQTEPFSMEAGETEERITNGETRWTLWD